MTRLAPVINCASIEDKNTIPFAISKGSPNLPNGIDLKTFSNNFKSSADIEVPFVSKV